MKKYGHCLQRFLYQLQHQDWFLKIKYHQMIASGLEVISPGANVPFADKEIFFGPIMEYTDSKVSLLPDFISNCGIARVFAYFMEAE